MPPTGLPFFTTIWTGVACVVVEVTSLVPALVVSVTVADLSLLLLPDLAITNPATAMTTTSPISARRLPCDMSYLLEVIYGASGGGGRRGARRREGERRLAARGRGDERMNRERGGGERG